MSGVPSPQSVPVAERLVAWVDDVQLSARVGFPHYANPGELKTDIRSLVEQLETLRSTLESIAAVAEEERLDHIAIPAQAALSIPANEQQVPDRILGVDLTGSNPACVCGEINTRHCPVHAGVSNQEHAPAKEPS